MTTNEIISAIVGVIVGAGISIPITVKITKSSEDKNKVKQEKLKTGGGDVIGRDKTHR